jgi:hypothetical protein
VELNVILPLAAIPLATETIFCSIMKHSTNCSGNFLKYSSENVEFFKSASNPTITLSVSTSPMWHKPSPYPYLEANSLPYG